jgi:hypothetical protein
MYHSQESEELVRRQVLDDCLFQLRVHLDLTLRVSSLWLLFHGAGFLHEILEHFVQANVSAAYQEIQVVKTRRLVFDEDEEQVYCERDKHLLLTRLVNGANVRHSIARDVVADDDVDEADEQVLAVFRAFVRKVCAERVQHQQILVWCVEERLAQDRDHEPQQIRPVLVILVVVVVGRAGHADATTPDQVLIDTVVLRRDSIWQWHDCKTFLEEEQTDGLHHVDSIDLRIE